MLHELNSIVQGGVHELLARVPFDDRPLEKALDLAPGFLGRARAAPSSMEVSDPEATARLARYLERFAVEAVGEQDLVDAVVLQVPPDASKRLDLGDRFICRCPRCGTLYRVGYQAPAFHIPTGFNLGDRRVELVYHTGKDIGCTYASQGGKCNWPRRPWSPQAIRVWDDIEQLDALKTRSPLIIGSS